MKAIPVTIETQKEYRVSMGETITTRPANLEELEVTENGTYVAPEDGGYTPVIVNVPIESDSEAEEIVNILTGVSE